MPEAIVVAAGCRGVGTSFVAGIAAFAACRMGRTVVLIDAVDGVATQHVLFGVVPRVNVWDLADPSIHPADVAMPIDEQLTLIPGAAPGTTRCPAKVEAREFALGRIAEAYAHADLFIIDAGSMLQAVRSATEVFDADPLLVTSSDRVTMAASHALAKALRMTHGQRRIAVAANRDTRGLEACEHLNAAATRFLGSPLIVAGSVPDDRSVHAALHAGFHLIDAAEDSIATIAVTGVLAARSTRREMAGATSTPTTPFLALSRGRS